MDIALNGPNTLFVATSDYHHWSDDGGLYKGTRNPGTGAWTWAKVLNQPVVSGVVVSTANSSILYAFVGQKCCSGSFPGQQAGIYKSISGGGAGSWTKIDNNGLMNLGIGKLYFSSSDTHKIYASTIGDGVFEGTISCGPVSEGFPDAYNDGIPDCAFTNIAQQVAIASGNGSIVSGNYQNLSCASAVDTNEVLSEGTSGGSRKLIKVWKFDNVPVGKQVELWVDGYRTPANGNNTPDAFNFSLTGKPAGSSCTNSDGIGSTLISLTNQSNNNVATIVNTGVNTSPVICLRVQDSIQGSDSKTETLTLDRVCLRALP